jgi:3-oxoacyl-[acyl-carrier-protein] synthase II
MGPMPEVESELPPGSVGGQAADLPADYCPALPREARYLRWTVEHALADAGLIAKGEYQASRVCAVLGTTLHGIRAGGRFLRSGDISHLRSFSSSATARLALRDLNIGGGVTTTCSACSSSLGAIALGVTLLETGQADVVIAGGYDAISEYAWAGFNALRLIAPGPLRPFCRGREGMKIAEGYGVVVLERADEAAGRGATIRAQVSGWGESADAHHLTQPHPQGEGALAAMRQALGRAGVTPRELGMVAAHATGTPDNDASEFQALSRLLGEDLPRVPVVGFKSFLGHTLGGAGAVELVMSSLAMRDGRVPACPNVDASAVEFAGLRVASGETEPQDIGRTLNTSLGFGGANTCVVLSKPGVRDDAPATSRPVDFRPEAWITGVGIVLPGSVGHAAFVRRARQAGLAEPPVRPERLDDAAIAEYLNVRRVRRLSQYVKFTLAAATMAVRDAQLQDHPARLASANAILGSAHGSACFCFEYYSQIIAQGALAANPVLFAEGVPNAAAAHLSTGLGVRGACQTIIGSRTAGLDALALAALRVQSGAAETVIVVAAEEPCEVVSRAYSSIGLERSGADGASVQDGFTSSSGGVAFVVESSSAAAARGAVPYASVLGSASAQATRFAGPAGAVASALSRLAPSAETLVGSACGTWVDRAEKLGLRRAGLLTTCESVHDRFGEVFSVTPLVGIAAQLADAASGTRFTSLCTDWSGAATAAQFEVLDRRLDCSMPQHAETRP